MPVDLSSSKNKGLRRLYREYVDKLGNFLSCSQPFWTSKLGIRSGTAANLEAGIAFMSTLGSTSLASGCVSLQDQTERALLGAGGTGWVVEKIRVGSAIMGHSAVAVYPEGKPMEQGYVFDPWLKQAPLVFRYSEWQGQFRVMAIWGKARQQ